MKLLNKKIFLGCVTGLATVSAVVTPLVTLTSCGTSNYKFEEYDKEYGVDKFVYNTVEKKFEKAFNDKVAADDTIPEDVKPLEIERNKQVLAIFREQLNKLANASGTKNLAYTAVSNALIDYAESEYGIKLNRETKASFSEIDRLYKGIYDSWRSTMINSGMSPAVMNAILQDAEKNFATMKKSLTAKYDDALSALIKAKKQMAVVFAAVNKDIGLMAATITLEDFFDNYLVEYKDTDSSINKIDNLEISTREKDGKILHFVPGTDITLWMNDIFTIRDTHTGNVIETGFRNDLIPGYEITPILSKINHDVKRNRHSIDIDWQCVKTTFTGQDAIDATAHLFNGDTTTLVDQIGDCQSIHDIFNKDHVRALSYDVSQTAEKNLADLMATYPMKTATNQTNDGILIDFKWDKDHNPCAYEPFLRGTLVEETGQYRHYSLCQEDLADTGLMYSTDGGKTWTRLDAITRSPSNMRQLKSEELLENLPVNDRNFIDGCSITADVLTKKSASALKANYGDEDHWAKVTLHYTYKTSKTTEEVIDVDVPEKETSGFPISKDAFYKILEDFNQTREFHNNYKNNVFEQDLKAMKTEKVLLDIATGLTVALDSIFIITSLMPTKDPTQKTINIAYVITSFLDLATQSATYHVFRTHKYDKTKDYANDAKKFKETTQYHALDDMLEIDANKYHLIIANEDGGIQTDGNGEGTFDYNYEHYWKDMKDEDFMELKSHYQDDGAGDVVSQYRNAAIANEVDIEQYHKDLDGWGSGEKWDKLTTNLTIFSLEILAIQLIIGYFDPSIKAAMEAKRGVQEGARTAAATSKNFFQRAIIAFKTIWQIIKNPKKYFAITKIFGQDFKNGEEMIAFIEKNLKEVFKLKDSEFFPLITMVCKDGITVQGKFKDAKELFEEIFKRFPCVTTEAAFSALTKAEKLEAGQKELMKNIFNEMREQMFLISDAPRRFEEYDNMWDAWNDVLERINVWFSSSTKRPGIVADNIVKYRNAYFLDGRWDHSFINILKGVLWKTFNSYWAEEKTIYFFKKLI